VNFVPLSLGKIFKFHDGGFIFVSRKICSLGGKRKVACNFREKKHRRFPLIT